MHTASRVLQLAEAAPGASATDPPRCSALTSAIQPWLAACTPRLTELADHLESQCSVPVPSKQPWTIGTVQRTIADAQEQQEIGRNVMRAMMEFASGLAGDTKDRRRGILCSAEVAGHVATTCTTLKQQQLQAANVVTTLC
eukprot:CAMPEP_0177668920 /NCGR_PEP_ID=MMETSP0447-20121125/23088_1 /TAXON_ID=0 /ORGANISM="Stygamoeba regulata, Strain BSH-02190019" /LENGTH=140 /DNA_ID=CAMNT_0019175599 /DNA_START=842 /DNA_END=1261 /DNA_ORIENTATION=-